MISLLPHAKFEPATAPAGARLRPRLVALALLGSAHLALGAATAEPKIDFARDIQPLLVSRCYDCHGAEKAKGGLHLTSLAHALRGGESAEPALVAGAGAKSLLIKRLMTDDPDDVMPQKGDRLAPDEIALLLRWIDEGAVWPENLKHWAYVKPVRPALPALASAGSSSRPLNAIDSFVFTRLEKEGLAPSPPADPARWLRRVSLDLIGLPPSPNDVVAFLADSPAGEPAYARAVDRLLASPHYGERWARPWLDLARYADSHGFQRDDLRDLWPYRDWVVRAMNADLPFDRFTIMQIAGDLLPQDPKSQNPDPARLDPLIATGFHRATPTNVEAGTDQEEGRVNQVFDRVNTTGAVWLGTTLECAQCHNHKYDPISQRDYYRLFAFFNSTERETDFSSAKAQAALKFTGPYLKLPDPATESAEAKLAARTAELDARIATASLSALADVPAWEQSLTASLATAGQTHPLEIAEFESSGEVEFRQLPDRSLVIDSAPDRDTYVITVRTKLTGITGFKLEALTDSSLPGSGPGRSDAARPNFVLNGFQVTAAPDGGTPAPVKLVRATASFSQAKFSVDNLLRPEINPREGWAISPQFARDHWAIFETDSPVGSAAGTTFTFRLTQQFGAARMIGRLRLSALTGRIGGNTIPAGLAAALAISPAQRTAAQTATLRDYRIGADPTVVALRQEKTRLASSVAAPPAPRTLVMRELAQPRATAVMKRGNFLDPGEPVQPGTPEVLHVAKPSSAQPTRLDLARWLIAPENPLVARVTVNRWWAEFFGRGLVATPEDFGAKGEAPTHPELLDWLAVEFVERGWSMKHVHRLIALSATYRQSSRITPESLSRDDQNRLLARGPRFRLDAEAIRDNALTVAGLLSPKLGGPPVRPFQPAGLWDNKVGGDKVTYDLSTGEDAYRRGLYTVWKRGSPYPSFVNFDATARNACTVRRSRSNTPLQALTLLNDPVYVEAARALAARVLRERPDTTVPARIHHAFQLCLARLPSPVELAALERLHAQQSAAHVTPATAWQAVAAALLNLDETITKN
jgi:hypothetical protein